MDARAGARLFFQVARGNNVRFCALAPQRFRGMLAGLFSRHMLTCAIPVSGETLPVIGLGTWQTFDVGPAPPERAPLAAVLREFAALGGTLIDSSPMYGRAEEVAGDLMADLGLREKLFVATKV